jgi:hypothetical protein
MIKDFLLDGDVTENIIEFVQRRIKELKLHDLHEETVLGSLTYNNGRGLRKPLINSVVHLGI